MLAPRPGISNNGAASSRVPIGAASSLVPIGAHLPFFRLFFVLFVFLKIVVVVVLQFLA